MQRTQLSLSGPVRENGDIYDEQFEFNQDGTPVRSSKAKLAVLTCSALVIVVLTILVLIKNNYI